MSKKKIYRSEIRFDMCVLASNLKEARELTKKFALREIDQSGVFTVNNLQAVDGKEVRIPKEWKNSIPYDYNPDDETGQTCDQILKSK